MAKSKVVVSSEAVSSPEANSPPEAIPTPKAISEPEEEEVVTSIPIEPMADDALAERIHDLLQQASHHRQIKKGANEVLKAINRGVAEIVVIAADAVPIELVLSLPLCCEDKSVVYVFVPSKVTIGRATGVKRNVIAAAITSNEEGELSHAIKDLQSQIEKIMI